MSFVPSHLELPIGCTAPAPTRPVLVSVAFSRSDLSSTCCSLLVFSQLKPSAPPEPHAAKVAAPVASEDHNAESLRRLRTIREGLPPPAPRALPVRTAQDELRELQELEERERKAQEASGSADAEACEPAHEEEPEEEPEPPIMSARERKLFELRRRMVKVRKARARETNARTALVEESCRATADQNSPLRRTRARSSTRAIEGASVAFGGRGEDAFGETWCVAIGLPRPN